MRCIPNIWGEFSKEIFESKSDEAKHLSRYDSNHDGEIDLQEWIDARKDTETEVEQEIAKNINQGGIHVLGNTNDKRKPFIISTIMQNQLI